MWLGEKVLSLRCFILFIITTVHCVYHFRWKKAHINSVLQGSLEMFTGLGLMLGPPLGGLLFEVTHTHTAYTAIMRTFNFTCVYEQDMIWYVWIYHTCETWQKPAAYSNTGHQNKQELGYCWYGCAIWHNSNFSLSSAGASLWHTLLSNLWEYHH